MMPVREKQKNFSPNKFEYDENEFNKLCGNLYTYICEFKRKKDLLDKEKDKILEGKSRIISLIKDNLDTAGLNKKFSDNLLDIESLEREFKTKKISFNEFLKRLGDLLA